MSELKGHFSPEDIQKTLEQLMATADFLVKLTPTTMDDNVVSVVKTVVSQPWFSKLISYVIHVIDPHKVPEPPVIDPLIVKQFFDGNL